MARGRSFELSKTDLANIRLWTASPLLFHEGHEFVTYPRFTECRKPPYTEKTLRDLDALSSRSSNWCSDGDQWIMVELAGKERWLLRSDVLNSVQYEEAVGKDG